MGLAVYSHWQEEMVCVGYFLDKTASFPKKFNQVDPDQAQIFKRLKPLRGCDAALNEEVIVVLWPFVFSPSSFLLLAYFRLSLPLNVF